MNQIVDGQGMVMTSAISVTLSLLKAEHHSSAAALLANSYNSHPMYQTLFREPKIDLESGLKSFFKEELSLSLQYNQPLIGAMDGETLVGVASVHEPDFPLFGKRLWDWRMRILMSNGAAITSRLLEKELRISQALAHCRYHCLNLLSVAPEYQNQGIGSALLAGVESKVDEAIDSLGSAIFVIAPRVSEWLKTHGYIEMAQVRFDQISGSLVYRPKRKRLAIE